MSLGKSLFWDNKSHLINSRCFSGIWKFITLFVRAQEYHLSTARRTYFKSPQIIPFRLIISYLA
jgi:hypothetical protein